MRVGRVTWCTPVASGASGERLAGALVATETRALALRDAVLFDDASAFLPHLARLFRGGFLELFDVSEVDWAEPRGPELADAPDGVLADLLAAMREAARLRIRGEWAESFRARGGEAAEAVAALIEERRDNKE